MGKRGGGQLSVTSSNALVTGLVLLASDGTHYSTHVTLDASAPSGTYYVQIIQGSATVPADGPIAGPPASGVVAFLHTPRPVAHTAGISDEIVFDDTPGGVGVWTGLCVVLSTTQFTKTLVTSPYMSIDGSVQ